MHSTDFPLQRWVRGEPRTSGHVVLAGNASAHAAALQCWLRLHELQHLTSPTAGWRELSCAVNVGGCPSLVDDVGAVLRERQGLWTLVLIREAQLAPAAAVGGPVRRTGSRGIGGCSGGGGGGDMAGPRARPANGRRRGGTS